MEPKQMTELRELTKPIIDWLKDNYHPHTQIIINQGFIKLTEDKFGFPTEQSGAIWSNPKQ